MELADFDGPYSWNLFSKADLDFLLLKIREIESRAWVEIDKNKKHDHYIDWDKLSQEAQRRLEALELDDGRDSLFSFRIGGKLRIYGLRINNVFCVLWWDPEHKACPSKGADN
ncbi:hypothetical protein [Sorangium sp. So ce1153]|uniref:hypothetical protein n=1 Tax=Sorangium sp. So ce1153 TaxID=3133333 RepID=UPI003F62EAEA